MDFDSFLADERTYDAVLRNLELIGEATKHVPASYLILDNPCVDFSSNVPSGPHMILSILQ